MDKPKLPAPMKVEGATSRQYTDHLNVMVIYLRELEKWHEWLISATEYRCRELKKENAALEVRCRELEKECDDADFMDARIADLERQLSQYKEAFHKAFNQFENITVSDTLAVVKERAHQMIGWAYAVLPDYALETGTKP